MSQRRSNPGATARATLATATVDTATPTAQARQCDADTVAALHRRRTRGLEPMACGHVDPLTCLARRPVDLTGHQLRAWRLTIAHLADLGLTAIVPAAVVNGARNFDGDDYDLAGGE
jgi:hypothetical protein